MAVSPTVTSNLRFDSEGDREGGPETLLREAGSTSERARPPHGFFLRTHSRLSNTSSLRIGDPRKTMLPIANYGPTEHGRNVALYCI